MLTKEQKQQLWEGCGFKKTDIPIDITTWHRRTDIYMWFEPGATGVSPMLNSLPPIDPNSLFKYAVPMAIEALMHKYNLSWWHGYQTLFERWHWQINDKSVDPAQALALAILKIQEGKSDKE